MTRWTVNEVRYLEAHAHEGADAVAIALGRSRSAVKHQAAAYGISLRRRWFCPKCGKWAYKPLNGRTGWCAACTKRARRWRKEDELADMREQKEREQAEDRRIAALYMQKSRISRK